jgi:hypothetical protein
MARWRGDGLRRTTLGPTHPSRVGGAEFASARSEGVRSEPGGQPSAPGREVVQHSIREGTPLARTAWLRMRGHIRLGSTWRTFTATQLLAPGAGFIWAATAQFIGVPVLGYDKYFDGAGEMRWRLGGLVPVIAASNAEISTGAAGRLAAESVLAPTRSGARTGAATTLVCTPRGRSTSSGKSWTSRSVTMANCTGWACSGGAIPMGLRSVGTPSESPSPRSANSEASPSQPRSVRMGVAHRQTIRRRIFPCHHRGRRVPLMPYLPLAGLKLNGGRQVLVVEANSSWTRSAQSSFMSTSANPTRQLVSASAGAKRRSSPPPARLNELRAIRANFEHDLGPQRAVRAPARIDAKDTEMAAEAQSSGFSDGRWRE